MRPLYNKDSQFTSSHHTNKMANKVLSISIIVTIFITFPMLLNAASCEELGRLSCSGKSFAQFSCSPPVTSATKAKLTNNDFSEGGDGGGESKCDEKFHSESEAVVALSTGWFKGGSRCGKKIKITASNGKSVIATVVDECDSINGCDDEHAGQPPCKNNIVDGSDAVWKALGLDIDLGVVDVTWSMA